jgi:outer membrane receptor protein involved in Fe transport
VPVVSDLPLIDMFSLEIGGRVSDYDPSGQVETYKLLGDWQINSFMRLRGGYNRATRAPNLNELFASRAQTVAGGNNTAGDPCSLANTATVAATDNWSANAARNTNGAAGAAHTQEICRALMARDSVAAGFDASVGQGNYYNRPLADMPTTLGGGATVTKGNPDVGPESADTYTVGLVVTSPFPDNAFLSGFSGSLDYYQIEISDMISVIGPAALIRDCFSQATNPTADIARFSCTTFLRDPLDGEGLYIDRSYTNQGWARLSGVDLQVNWRGDFTDLGLSSIPGGAGVNFVATIPQEQLTQSSPSAPIYDSIGTQYTDLGVGGGAYDYTTLTTFNYFLGDFDMSLRWEYTPSILADEIVTNPASPKIGVPKGASLFGLSGNYRLNDAVTLRGGIDNLLNELPPIQGHGTTTGRPYNQLDLVRGLPGFGSSGVGAGAYDVLGRRYFVGVTVSY